MTSQPRNLLVAIAATALLCGCISPWDEPRPAYCPEETPWLGPPALAGVADTLSVCGGRYALRCDLWRDFMPDSLPNGSAMVASATLTECDSLVVSDRLLFEHLWVVRGAEFWSTGFNDEAPEYLAPYRVRAAASCGPKWDPGLLVDVIVSVRCGGGAAQYVRARNVIIGRTE